MATESAQVPRAMQYGSKSSNEVIVAGGRGREGALPGRSSPVGLASPPWGARQSCLNQSGEGEDVRSRKERLEEETQNRGDSGSLPRSSSNMATRRKPAARPMPKLHGSTVRLKALSSLA